MVIKVNPPPQIKMPSSFANDPEIRSFFKFRDDFNRQIWTRTGAGNDLIDETDQAITSAGSRISRNAAQIQALEKTDFEIEIITADFTTNRNQIIICNNTAAITVTLDPLAVEEDTVHIKRKIAKVTVSGPVDGRSTTVINVKNFSMHLVFDGIEWSQI